MLKYDKDDIVDISEPPEDLRIFDESREDLDFYAYEELGGVLMLYTSYYGNIRNLKDHITISISLKTPIYVDAHLSELAPTWDMLSKFKETRDQEEYVRRYKEEILGRLNPMDIIGKIRRIMMTAKVKSVVLLCYERRGDFCHRHLVSDWLKGAGYSIEEFH